jgi:glucan 1,3-beta-glucosidase
MLRPSLQSLFAVCAFFSVAFANALPNNGPVKYETVVVYETITTCITTSSVYTISAPVTTCSLSSSGVIIPPPSPPPPQSTSAPSQEYTASTVYITTVKTITSCASTVQSCPATEATHTYVVTDTISSYVTTCPVTATQTPPEPSSSSYPVSPSPSPSTSVSKSYSETKSHGPTGPSSSASASPSASVSKSYSETKSYGPSDPSSSAPVSPTYPVSTSTVSSVSSVATYQPTSDSTLSPSASGSVTASASYTTVSSSSAVSSSYSVSSPSTSSVVGNTSSSPTYSASKSTSSTVSVPTSSSSKTLTTSSSTPTPTACSYWMENIKHQGIAPFAGSGYQVFRNVKDAAYGAKGDGVTDDTAAIQKAISTGSNCPPDGTCQSSSTTPALIYFPPGTYIISTPVLMHYGSSLIGNPNCPPVLKAKSTFPIPDNPNYSTYIVDGNAYGTTGNLAYGATNTFWRQFRNFVLDTIAVRADANILGLHWPTAQATSVENVVFKASDAPGTTQGGMLSEQGSGGFMGNLTFYGGSRGLDVANQYVPAGMIFVEFGRLTSAGNSP